MTKSFCSMSAWLCLVLWALLCQGLTSATVQLCGKRLADVLDVMCADRGYNMGKRSGRSIGSVYRRRPDLDSKSNTNTNINSMNSNTLLPHSLPPHHSQSSFINHNMNNLDNLKDFDGVTTKVAISNAPVKDLSYYKRKRSELVNFLSHVQIARRETSANDAGAAVPMDGGGLVAPGAVRRRRRQAPAQNVVEECCMRACEFDALLSYCAPVGEPEDDWAELEFIRRLLQRTSPRPPTTQRPRSAVVRRPPAQINRGSNRESYPFFYVRTENQATRSPLLVQQRLHQQQQQRES